MACRCVIHFISDTLPLVTLSVEHQSVVTSGIYERYFIQENQLFHHILDSTTGYPVDNDIASVTIISDHGLMARYGVQFVVWSVTKILNY